MKKIFVLNTLGIGIEILDLIKDKFDIKGIIGLSNHGIDFNKVSGYVHMKSYCEKNIIPYYEMKTYSLDQNDLSTLLKLDIDILLVLGWQRLIPDLLIQHVNEICIGAHGSPWGIQKGRGRSPMNWALILGKTKFEISLFKINEGIDSGEIIKSGEFNITEFDTIETLYLKSCLIISDYIVETVLNPINDFKSQTEDEIYYLPQRLPEDGQIDWTLSVRMIYNHIRALTKPFPGAYSYLDGRKVIFWDAIPFQDNGFDVNEPGKIIHYFTSGYMIVSCGDGNILIRTHDMESGVSSGVFSHSSALRQHERIIERHYKKHPNHKINPEIESLFKESIIDEL